MIFPEGYLLYFPLDRPLPEGWRWVNKNPPLDDLATRDVEGKHVTPLGLATYDPEENHGVHQPLRSARHRSP